MLFSTLASIVVVAIDCESLKCEWVVLLFVFLDGKFVPAPKLLNMSYLLCKLSSYTTELQSISNIICTILLLQWTNRIISNMDWKNDFQAKINYFKKL